MRSRHFDSSPFRQSRKGPLAQCKHWAVGDVLEVAGDESKCGERGGRERSERDRRVEPL